MSEEHNDFKCNECDRTYKNAAALKTHARIHEPRTTPIVRTNSFSDLPELQSNNITTEEIEDSLEYTPPTNLHYHTPPTLVLIRKLPNYDPTWPDINRATPGSAGVDLRAAIPGPVCIGINKWLAIPAGICMAMPDGYVALCCPRSGLAKNNGITVLNAPGVVDCDFRGELCTILVNNTTSKYWIKPGDRISQLVIIKLVDIVFKNTDVLPDSIRGESGFGSSGI